MKNRGGPNEEGATSVLQFRKISLGTIKRINKYRGGRFFLVKAKASALQLLY